MKIFLSLFSLLLLPVANIQAQDNIQSPRDAYPRHEVRAGWGDMMYETAVYHNSQSLVDYRFTGHIFGEYSYNFLPWLAACFQIDCEAVYWKQISDGSSHNFYNLSMLPSARFTYYRKGCVTMYSGIGAGLLINSGSDTDYRGRTTVCAPLIGITAFGVSAALNNWFASAEIGGLNALNGRNEIYMIGSRLFSISIGYRF